MKYPLQRFATNSFDVGIKLAIIPVLAFLCMLTPVGAVQYYVGNSGAGASSNGVIDMDENALSGVGGSAAIGYFDSEDFSEAASAADLLDDNWHVAGDASGNSETNFNKSTPLNGTFTVACNLTDPGFDGKNIYLVIGNGSSLNVSTEFFVYKFDATFDSTQLDPITLNLDDTAPGGILVGVIGPSMSIVSGGDPSQPTFQLQNPPGYVPVPALGSLSINEGAPSTDSRTVILNHAWGGEEPDEFMASEHEDFAGATWQAYTDAPDFQLSPGPGLKKVYFKLKNSHGESSVENDEIEVLWNGLVELPDNTAILPISSPIWFITAAIGNYSGFLTATDGSGQLGYFNSVKIGDLGSFSATMYFGDNVYLLKGRFDGSGHFFQVVNPEGDASPATVNLQLVITPGGAFKLEGSVEAGDLSAVVAALRSGDTSDLKGRYTLLIPGAESEASAPQAYGYGKMLVSSTGVAKLSGRLGDGKAWKVRSYVTSEGEMLLYVRLYNGGTGWLGGLIHFRDVAGVSDCDGKVQWYKRNEFDLQRSLIGSRYKKSKVIAGDPGIKPDVIASVGAGSGFNDHSVQFFWSEANKRKAFYTGPVPEEENLELARRSGQIMGWTRQAGVDFMVDAVVFQKQDLAAGMVRAPDKTPRKLVILPLDILPID